MRRLSSKLWLISLFSVIILSISCSLDLADTGDMTLTLPTARTISESSYEITLTNSSGKEVVYTTNGGEYTIPKVKLDKYKISVFTTTSKNAYYGEENIVVRPGKNKVNLNLKLITLKKIDVKLKENAYVPYGSTIEPTSFDITEYYEVPGYSKQLVNDKTNYSFYSVTPSSKITEVGDISCTIKNIYKNVSKNSSIPCLFTLPTPTVTVDSKDLNLVTGDRKTINASVNIESTLPKEYYTVKYHWMRKVNKTDDFYSIGDKADSPSFSIPTVSPANWYYACKVTLEPVERYKKYSTNQSLEKLSDEIHVKVTQKNPNAPYIKSITAKPKQDAYVLLNESIKIESFDITETYSDGSTKNVTDYSSYSLSTKQNITKIGDTEVTISKNSVNTKATIPCKFNLPRVQVNVNSDQNLEVVKGSNKKLKATFTISEPKLQKDAYSVIKMWFKDNKQITDANTLSYNIDTNTLGKHTYKFGAKVEPTTEFEEFCIDTSANTIYSETINVTIVEPNTPQPSNPITSISIAPKAETKYLVFGEAIDINSFTITEHYSNGDSQQVSDYSKYNISPEIIDDDSLANTGNNNVVVTISRIDNKEISAINSDLPCKYKLANAKVSLTSSGTINIAQNSQHTVTANVSGIPQGSCNLTYNWNNPANTTTQTLTIPSRTLGQTKYNCVVTFKPLNYGSCIDVQSPNTKSVTSNELTVNVTSDAEPVFKDGKEINQMIKNAGWDGIITLNDNYLINEEILISKNITIKTAKGKDIIIKKAPNFIGSIFSTTTAGPKFTLGSQDGHITLDGNNVENSGNLIKINSSGQLIMDNCTLQNNKEGINGGGAIYDVGKFQISNSIIKNNSSTKSGGAIFMGDGISTITNTSITGNTSQKNGGAIAILNTTVDLTINNTADKVIENNNAVNGGGIYITKGTLTLNNATTISNNTCTGMGKNIRIDPVNGTPARLNGTDYSNPQNFDDSVTSSKKTQ